MFRSPVTPLEVAGKSVIMTRDTAGAVHVFTTTAGIAA